MTPAELAAANAIQFEAVLYAYRKNNTGTVVSFVVHPDDMPPELATARIGARFVAVLVQIGDDELPIPQAAKESKKTATVNPATPRRLDKPAGAKPPPQSRAAMLSKEPRFAVFLREERPDDWHETGDAEVCLKLICGVERKRDLATDHKAFLMFNLLESAYRAWLERDRVVA